MAGRRSSEDRDGRRRARRRPPPRSWPSPAFRSEPVRVNGVRAGKVDDRLVWRDGVPRKIEMGDDALAAVRRREADLLPRPVLGRLRLLDAGVKLALVVGVEPLVRAEDLVRDRLLLREVAEPTFLPA